MELIKKIFASLAIYAVFLLFLALFLSNVIRLDEYLFFLIYNSKNAYVLEIFNIVTYLGSSLFWFFLIILLWLKDKRKLSIHLLYAFMLDTASLLILKTVFLRPRPVEALKVFEFDIGPSFPSGHSQRTFSGAVVLSNYYKKYRILFYVIAMLVSFSRIYMGVHYPLDVVIGAVNGIITGMVALIIPLKRIQKKLIFKN
jgi:undecaprenyl-diphosphatase